MCSLTFLSFHFDQFALEISHIFNNKPTVEWHFSSSWPSYFYSVVTLPWQAGRWGSVGFSQGSTGLESIYPDFPDRHDGDSCLLWISGTASAGVFTQRAAHDCCSNNMSVFVCWHSPLFFSGTVMNCKQSLKGVCTTWLTVQSKLIRLGGMLPFSV